MTVHGVRRSSAEWSKLVKQWRSSGCTARAFAQEHGLTLSTLKWWSRQFPKEVVRGEGKSGLASRPVPTFAQVRVVNAAASSGVIEVVARNGLVVRLGSVVDSEALVRVLAAVLRC